MSALYEIFPRSWGHFIAPYFYFQMLNTSTSTITNITFKCSILSVDSSVWTDFQDKVFDTEKRCIINILVERTNISANFQLIVFSYSLLKPEVEKSML